VRITQQLELIISDLGIPVGSGGSISDFICAVSRGLIQFVCARQGRGLFSSLTAEKIQIHPSSVMFRQDIDFIVAGEIVRTTRMYAMSVSPLTKQQLYQISPLLAEQIISLHQRSTPIKNRFERVPSVSLGKKKYYTEEKSVSQVESILIQDQSFLLERNKEGKKTVVLDWQRLSKIMAKLSPLDESSTGEGLKARIEWNGYQLFGREKLSTVLKALAFIDIDKDLSQKWPRKKNFSLNSTPAESLHSLKQLANYFNLILHVTKFKKASQLAFIGLYSDGAGNFWFQPTKSFSEAINQSLANAELLIDFAKNLNASSELKEQIGALYRKLSDFISGI
jgi:hypothetical protein